MSSPVHTVSPELPLTALAEELRAWGFHGAPVVRDGTLLGVISRADVERARAHGREDLPVSSHMHTPVETTSPETPIDATLETLLHANTGRLPVLRGGKLVGIVTRTDLLRALYRDDG